MGLGVVLSQLLNLMYIPLFSRIFAQEAYAVQGNFISIINIIYVICSLGLVSALAIPRKKKRIDLLLRVILLFTFLLCLLLFVVIFLLEHLTSFQVTYFLFKIDNKALMYLFPITILARTTMFVYEVRISLSNNFKLLSISKVWGALTYGLGVIVFYYLFKSSDLSLIIGTTVSYLLLAITLFLYHRINFFVVSIVQLKHIFKRYRNFIYFSLPNMLLNAISTSIPVILLLHYYGEFIAGNYAMAIKIVAIPVSFVVSSLRAVYLKKLSEIYRTNRQGFYSFVRTVMWYSHGGSFFLFLIIFISSPFFISIFLGSDWKDAYMYIQILCPWYFLLIGNSPLSLIFDIIERQKENLLREIALLIFRISSISVSFYLGYSGIVALYMFVFVSFVFNVLLSWMILSYSKKSSFV